MKRGYILNNFFQDEFKHKNCLFFMVNFIIPQINH